LVEALVGYKEKLIESEDDKNEKVQTDSGI
jgi:hypothetical protein